MRAIGVLVAGLIVLGAGGSSPHAADRAGNYSVYAGRTCGAYLDARKNNSDNSFGWWVAGYITAANFVSSDTSDYLHSTDVRGAMAWLEKHCREKPLDAFDTAAAALLIELYPKRQVKAP